MQAAYNDEMEIYIHIPFCVRKCLYCDFLSAPADESARMRYVSALKNEIINRSDKEVWPAGKMPVVPSVFFGGGTPTVLGAGDLSGILSLIKERFNVKQDAEITIECNPGTADEEKLSVLRRAGFNRISIGLQSTDDEMLRKLGRIHNFEDFLRIWKAAREAGFENTNIDIITGLPGQTLRDISITADKVLSLEPRPKHISLYSLIIEEGTEFKKLYDEGKLDLPDEDEERKIHWNIIDAFENAGYRQYELSNLALPGYECAHNSGYWTGREYLGFGTGAASYLRGIRYADTRSLDEYVSFWTDSPAFNEPSFPKSICRKPEGIAASEERLFGPLSEKETLTESNLMEEFMFLGLRMTKGIDTEEFKKRFGKDIREVYGDIIDKHMGEGLLIKRDGRLYLSRRGQDLANYVMSDMILEKNISV